MTLLSQKQESAATSSERKERLLAKTGETECEQGTAFTSSAHIILCTILTMREFLSLIARKQRRFKRIKMYKGAPSKIAPFACIADMARINEISVRTDPDAVKKERSIPLNRTSLSWGKMLLGLSV